ncbi:MAG: serine/threonine protein kinase [Deltaproteobacteria bacterium]|nr:serine/threonine protein kinase [Deltaproteobacteria bacterium]
MDADPDLTKARIGKTLKGRYTLDALIGIGGMASVYRGRHRNGNKVAVKVLHPDLAMLEDIRKRFLREGYVANKVDHRGAVRVLDDDVDEEDDSVFLVMELLEGETLEELITRRGGTLPPEEILPRVKQLLEVLAAAHDKGIVHRDLKPENVFLEREGGGLKVLDFGIARLADGTGTTTHTGQVIGTPAYMAPEQARGETTRVGPASDLWAVGAIMFRALTGRVVYEAKAPAMSVVLAGTRPPPKIADVMPTIDPALATVIDRTIDPVIEERWSSAAEMLVAIEKLEGLGAPTVSRTEVASPMALGDLGDRPTEAVSAHAQQTLIVDAPNLEQGRDVASPTAPTPAPTPFARSAPPPPHSAPPPAHSAPPPPRSVPPPAAPGRPPSPHGAPQAPRRADLRIALVALVATIAGGVAFGAYVVARGPQPTAAVSSTASSDEPQAQAASEPTASTAPVVASAPAVVSAFAVASAPASASPSSATATAPSSPPASAAAPHDDPPAAPRPPRGIGTVFVIANPPAKVMSGGAVLCDKTPCRKPLPAGDHLLRLSTADGTTKVVPVTIRAGEVTAKTLHMK